MQKETRLQFPLFTTETEWTAPYEFVDLTGAKEIAIDLEHVTPTSSRWVRVGPARTAMLSA
jgi:hypothetical protein